MKHSLKLFTTATSGVQNLPEFLIVAMVDEVLLGYCDSNVAAEPKQEWARKFTKDNPQQQEWYVMGCISDQQYFRNSLSSFKQRLNQTEGTVYFCSE